ncbi:MAG: M56 family metallopeptidase [Acidobacteriales bacterium]|nr:M56 family metallopeptidase [Terriglobales bacterium]
MTGTGSNQQAASSRGAIHFPASWAEYIAIGWAIASLIGIARVGLGFWKLRALRRSCRNISAAALDPLVCKTWEEFQVVRRTGICSSDRVNTPAAIGFFKPLVVLPEWALRELSPPELNAVLLHELSHLARWDDWTNLLQKLLRAVLFYHPAAWWVDNELCLEREMACDDLVLAKTESPRDYAECLVRLAERSFIQRNLALAHAAIGKLRRTSRRVTNILDGHQPVTTRVWKPLLAAVSTLSVALLIPLQKLPPLMAFTGKAKTAETGLISTAQPFDIPTKFNQIDDVPPAPTNRGKGFASPRAKVIPARRASPAHGPGLTGEEFAAVRYRPPLTDLPSGGASNEVQQVRALESVWLVTQRRTNQPSELWMVLVWRPLPVTPEKFGLERTIFVGVI